MHSRVTIFSISPTTMNPQRELKPMHQMQWQEHMKCSSPPLSNPTKETKAMEEYEKKNKENTNELQDLDPQGSPHKEEIDLVENVDLDLLSLFPQKGARIIGGKGS